MPEDNEGYDLEIQVPGEPGLRYVEVKGLGEAWDVRGVRLTPAELRAAHREGDRYWLYVVEYAKDPRHRRLYRICNPAGHATAYCLDQGWAVLDEPEVVILPPAPGRILFDGDSRIGEILEVKELGEARRIVVDQGEGRRRTLTWNPATHRIMEK
jgi:hypothetical protein